MNQVSDSEQQLQLQVWQKSSLLWLLHCIYCQKPREACERCRLGKVLFEHTLNCADPECTHTYGQCRILQELFTHFQTCRDMKCCLCFDVTECLHSEFSCTDTAASTVDPACSSQPLLQQQRCQQLLAEQRQRQHTTAPSHPTAVLLRHLLSSNNNWVAMRDRQHYIQSLQRRLMFLRHCARCQHDEALCPLFGEGCKVGKELWAHVTQCCDEACTVPRCGSSKAVLRHHQACKDMLCPICIPVKEYVQRTRHRNNTAAAGSRGNSGAAAAAAAGAPQHTTGNADAPVWVKQEPAA